MTMITPSYLGETIEYSSLHACRSTLEDPTHRLLFHCAADLVNQYGIRLAIHLAETKAELALLLNRSGPFVDFLAELGAWNSVHPQRDSWSFHPAQYIQMCERAAAQLLLVHCNYLASSTLIPRETTIVYCPRTHAAFGHPPHPFRDFIQRGVRVALGTDSLASNPDLDVLAEARFLHRQYPDFSGATLLRMATLAGAEALGWADETGSLTPGKSADLAVVPLPNEDTSDPHQLLLRSPHRVVRTIFRGQ